MTDASEGAIRVGIAGLGRSGWNIHAKALGPMRDKYRIVAAADADAARREEAAAIHQCRTYEHFDQLPEDDQIELLVVATPSHLHSDLSIKALRAGRHVVCEKPMALNTEAADGMIDAAEQAGRVLTIFQNMRYEAGYRKVREVIDSGRLGQIVQIRLAIHGFSRRWDWQTLREYGGGTLNNTGAHLVDIALQLFGDHDPQVWSDMRRALTSGDAEDHVKVILRAPGAALVDVEITSACAYPQEKWLVMGTAGGLHGTARELHWKWVDFSKMPPRPVDRTPLAPGRQYQREAYQWQEESWTAAQGEPSAATQFYDDLHATLRQGRPLVITPRSVRRQIAVLTECHRQADL